MRQPRGSTHRIAHRARLREQRLGRRRGRERGAAAIHDGAAQRLQGDGPRVLALRERGALGVPHELQVDETGDDSCEREGEDRREDENPRAERRGDHDVKSLT